MLIKRYLFIPFTVVFITGINCSSHLDLIKSTKLSWKLPILDKKLDTIFRLDGSIKLFFYKDILLYEKEGIFIHADDKEEKVYTYWVYKQNHEKGVKFKASFQDTVGVTFDVDSFLVKNAFKNFPFYTKESDSLISSKTTNNNRELIEKYIPKSKPDDTYPDIVRHLIV